MPFSKPISTPLFLIIVPFSLLFTVTSLEYTLQYFNSTAPKLWDNLFALSTTEKFALGLGSVGDLVGDLYRSERVWLAIHTIGGAVVLALGPLLVNWNGTLSKWRKWHKTVGWVYVFGGGANLLGSSLYQLRTGPGAAYGSRIFSFVLWGLSLLTFEAFSQSIVAIRRRAYKSHASWALYHLALIASAPLLRLGWVFAHHLWKERTLQELNLPATAPILPALACGVVVMRAKIQGEWAAQTEMALPKDKPFGLLTIATAAGIPIASLPILREPALTISSEASVSVLFFIRLCQISTLATCALVPIYLARPNSTGRIYTQLSYLSGLLLFSNYFFAIIAPQTHNKLINALPPTTSSFTNDLTGKLHWLTYGVVLLAYTLQLRSATKRRGDIRGWYYALGYLPLSIPMMYTLKTAIVTLLDDWLSIEEAGITAGFLAMPLLQMLAFIRMTADREKFDVWKRLKGGP